MNRSNLQDDPWSSAMRRGDLEAAWRVCDRVLAERQLRHEECYHWPRHLQFIWQGQPFDGARVLVRCYHGLGDTIQFARLFAPLRARAGEVIVWVQPALLSLLASVCGVDRYLALHDGVPDAAFDVDIELMELPHALRLSWATLPNPPYIYVSPARTPSLSPSEFHVGLAWRSGDWNAARSVPASALRLLDGIPGVRFHSLQYPHETLPFTGGDLASRDIAAMAAAMQQLDLVISVDTMVAHLAGAMNLPTWTLLSRDPDWRWMTDRHDSPWYPSMRLFRQIDSWDSLLQQVRSALTAIAAPDTRSDGCRAFSN